MIDNLLFNVIKFMVCGGMVIVWVCFVDGVVEFLIVDIGVGILEDE